MKPTTTILFLCLLLITLFLPGLSAQTTIQSYEINKISKTYVHVPVKTGAPKTWVTVNIDGVKHHEFEVELAPADPDFYATLEVGQWRGKKLTLTAEKVTSDSKWLALTKTSNELSDEPLVYTEELRPQFHFAPRRGWTNDPNGLVFYKGIYHLFFQHNPWGTGWGNMTWGHAISRDLLHWNEGPDAVLPDKNGVVFSGSGVVDWNNTSGLQTNPVRDKTGKIINPPLILFHTSIDADRGKGKACQSMNYSLDEGKTWINFPGNPVIPHLIGGNRDPKVFWYSDKAKDSNPKNGHWVMALYLDGQDYALFTSANLINWEKVCDIKNVGCSECPDMFELPVDGSKLNSRWVFWGGDGKYLIGSFNGREFTIESGPFTTKYGGNDYAAQSYSDIPEVDGRRIQFSWMAGGEYPKMPFNQQFTVPRNLTLRSTPEGIRLFMEPAKEIEKLRISKAINFSATLQGMENPLKVPALNGNLLDLEMVLDLKIPATSDTTVVINTELFGQKISYNLGSQKIDLAGIKAPLAPVNHQIKLRIITDRTSIEIFANDGLVQIAKCFVNKDKVPANMAISGNKDLAEVKVKSWQLVSVWGNQKK